MILILSVGGIVRNTAVVGGLVVLLLFVGPTLTSPEAAAQEYGELQGVFEEVPASAEAGGSFPLRGAGFAPNSTIEVLLVQNASGQEVGPGTATADDSGTLATGVALPPDLEPGPYTLTASGIAVDGGSRVLAADLQIQGDLEETGFAVIPDPISSGSGGIQESSGGGGFPLALGGGLLVLGVGLLIAGAWWLFNPVVR